jgi:hypothetical protein
MGASRTVTLTDLPLSPSPASSTRRVLALVVDKDAPSAPIKRRPSEILYRHDVRSWSAARAAESACATRTLVALLVALRPAPDQVPPKSR